MGDPVQDLRELIRSPRTPWESTGAVLREVCDAAARALSVSGAGVSVMTADGVRGVFAATDPASERMEEAQFVLGEGPCIDAFTTRRPVLIADLHDGAAQRWPAYTPAALADGFHAVFAFPLQIGAARLGVLDLFRRKAGPLSGTQIPLALSFADITVETLLDRQSHSADSTAATPGGPADEVEHSAELFQAQGMVMVQLGVTLGEATARLRSYAFTEGRSLGDVAHDIVERRVRLDRDPAGPDRP